MLGHSVMFSKETDLREFEIKLGDKAELGVSFQLIDVNGMKMVEDGYNPDTTLPMASTNKIGIALAVLIFCFAPNSVITLNQTVSIIRQDLSPGFLQNPLDKFYFETHLSDPIATPTISDLLKYMLMNSDNTATDRLLELIGGQTVVNSIINDFNCHTYKLTRNLRNLLSCVYQINIDRSEANIEAWKKVIDESVDVLRYQAEVETFENAADACSPRDMCTLLNLIVRSASSGRKSQLHKPASHLLKYMMQCKTGAHRIKDILSHRSDIEFVAHKTGTLGGVANDAAIIKFSDGQHAIITVFTAFSNANLEVREKVIADIARKLLCKYKPIVKPDRQYSVSY